MSLELLLVIAAQFLQILVRQRPVQSAVILMSAGGILGQNRNRIAARHRGDRSERRGSHECTHCRRCLEAFLLQPFQKTLRPCRGRTHIAGPQPEAMTHTFIDVQFGMRPGAPHRQIEFGQPLRKSAADRRHPPGKMRAGNPART